MTKDEFLNDVVDHVKYKFQSCAGTFLPTPGARKEIRAILEQTVLRALRKDPAIWDVRGQKHVEHVACRIARRARQFAKRRKGTRLGTSDVRRAANEVIPNAVRTLERALKLSKTKTEKAKIIILKRFC